MILRTTKENSIDKIDPRDLPKSPSEKRAFALRTNHSFQAVTRMAHIPIPENRAAHAITLRGISKTYASVTALYPTDLSVEKGEFLTLLGPSGSGKTTLLNLIAGAIKPAAGTILLDGRDITHMPPRERGIGMVFQNYALMPHMTVFNNVAYPLRARGESSTMIRAKVTEALERVGLRGFENRKPRELSGGQQQRVGIARCIVYSPAIIMMDEPLGALDKNLRGQMQSEIKRLHNELGATIIYVTHDQEEALNMSDRICLMTHGEIAQLGTPDELYFQPRNRFVAEFIGESNLIAGKASGGRMAVAANQFIAVPDCGSGELADFLIMVRPERVQIVGPHESISNDSNVMDGEVVSTSFIGGMTRVAVRTDGGPTITATMVSGRAPERAQAGERVRLCWSPSDMVVLKD